MAAYQLRRGLDNVSFTVEYLEYIILIMVRVGTIIFAAPFYGNASIPMKVKAAIAFFLSMIIINTVEYDAVSYVGLIGYFTLVIKEALVGLFIGVGSGFCVYILNFAGHMIDMEIGFSMAQEMDPTTNVHSTLTANIFTALFLLLFLVSDMHYFVVDAMCDSFKAIPIGGGQINGNLIAVIVEYITDFFIIGFRIILPVFTCILIINVVLGILAKIAPQMNMFVIGMQLKVFVGLSLLFMLMGLFPGVVDFIFEEMQKMTALFTGAVAP